MGQSVGGAPCLLALAACVSFLCYVSGDPNDRQSGKITFEQEQIFVNVLGGPTFSLLVELDEAGYDLRCDINEIEGIPYGSMTLMMGDILLNTTRSLSECNINARAQLTLEIPEHQNHRPVNVTVKTLDGKEFRVSTQLGDSVASLKENVTRLTGIPPEEQRLLLRGLKELKEDRKLALYEIYNGTTIDLGGPLEECRQTVTIFVKTLSTAIIELEVNLIDTAIDLKEKIWEKAGVPTGVQRLYANERLITGQDHLCDFGLKDGSTVHMFLYSSRITSLDQVARLQEPHIAAPSNPFRSPIFREVEDPADTAHSHGRPNSLYKDARNWIAWSLPRPGSNSLLVDPISYLRPNPDDEKWIEQYQRELAVWLPYGNELQRLEAEIIRARLKLSLAVRPFRVAANLTSASNHDSRRSGISLGGGSNSVSTRQLVQMGADVNNWAPDALSDADVMRLFEVSERVRQVMARDAQTGEGVLSIAGQRRINRAILYTYLEALAGYSSAIVCNQPRQDDQCGICIDELTVEPAVELACEHAFHAECIHSWVTKSHQMGRFPTCPFCRQRFMLPYEALGKAELETPEFAKRLS